MKEEVLLFTHLFGLSARVGAKALVVLAASLAELAEALRGAVSWYADTEDQVLARGRGAAGAA